MKKSKTKTPTMFAVLMRIVRKFPDLTTQQIISKEHEFCGYRFLTDNKLRRLRALRLVENVVTVPSGKGKGRLLTWRATTSGLAFGLDVGCYSPEILRRLKRSLAGEP